MTDRTGIEWTDATWQVTHGCSVVSPGCTNCYAMKMAARLEAMGVAAYAGLTTKSKAGPVWNGTVRLASDEALTQPLRWKKPRRIFVNSMSDLFADGVEDEWIDRAFAVMALCPQHTFQVLTKRPERMREWMKMARVRSPAMREMIYGVVQKMPEWRGDNGKFLRLANEASIRWPLPNVWLGTSVEDQQRADERIPHVLATPAAVRFLSCEPLLGPVDLHSAVCRETGSCPSCPACLGTPDWVIVGGESGPNARPMHPDWARSLRDQCQTVGVPFFFKQWGEWTPGVNVTRQGGTVETALFDNQWDFGRENLASTNGHIDDEPDLYRVGKRAAGAMLDGREWREFPV